VKGKITELNVAATLKDVSAAHLLDADVNYKGCKARLRILSRKKALGMNVLTAIKPGQLMVKIVHDELARVSWVVRLQSFTSLEISRQSYPHVRSTGFG
jgi:signal recognition particle subunit SRP54